MSFNSTPPIDRATLSELTGGDTEFEIELVSTFIEAGTQLLSELTTALPKQDHKQIQHLAHSLKGSSQSIGANHFAALCSLIEKWARDLGADPPCEWANELQLRFDSVQSALSEMQAESSS